MKPPTCEGRRFYPRSIMEDWGEYEPPQPSLLDGDYCEETTEEYDEGYIPYSLRLLQERRKVNENRRTKNDEKESDHR